jgi:biopolymer transport protein ExbD
VLPDSAAEQRTEASPVVMITPTEILLQGKKITARSAIEQSPEQNIPALQAALLKLPKEADTRRVTIMGDKATPYQLLRKVMLSCSQAEYDQIALAVTRRDR